jgi:Tfp pilus assembly protein PilZ
MQHLKMAFADAVQIQKIGLGGISVKAERRMNIGKEYILKLENKKNIITTKGIVVWALLSESKADSKGNIISIYSHGLKFTNDTNEQIERFMDVIDENKKETDEQRTVSLQANEFIDLSVQFKEVLEVFQ